jgi:hypothetical protein
MIDYRLHLVALQEFTDALAAEVIADPAVAHERDEDLAAAQQNPALARLGALTHYLVWHASADGRELQLLEDAAALWAEGLELYGTLGRFRAGLERVLNDPADTTGLVAFNTVGEKLRAIVPNVLGQDQRIKALKDAVLEFSHVPPHPRQEDRQLQDWTWSDILLARRTDAFVRELARQSTRNGARAFGVGALSGYGANAAGSMYLGQVVGGPRRSHRFRDRLARNTVGSWIGTEWPGAPTLGDTADLLAQEFPAGLPAEVESAIRDAAENTYPMESLPGLPDLGLGFSRLLRHLRLLDGFGVPSMPEPPAEPFLSALFGNPSQPYVPSMPEQTGLVEAGQPAAGHAPGSVMPLSMGTDDGPDHSEPPASTEVKCGAFWEALGWSVLFLLGGWFACLVEWAGGRRCALWDDITQNWEAAFPDGAQGAAEVTLGSNPQSLTTDDAAALAQLEEMRQLGGDLHNMETMMWEGFQKAADFLALHGLIYPDAFLGRWRYSQYLSVRSDKSSWPRVPDGGPRFDEYPTTALELPEGGVVYWPGSAPSVILIGQGGSGRQSASSVSLPVWFQIAEGTVDADNLDLDGDRGWRHACWATGGSITDQPLDVRFLDYSEV